MISVLSGPEELASKIKEIINSIDSVKAKQNMFDEMVKKSVSLNIMKSNVV